MKNSLRDCLRPAPEETLTSQINIYSLALSFFSMESGFFSNLMAIKMRCCLKARSKQSHEEDLTAMDRTLPNRGLFKVALGFERDKRFGSMDEFSKAVMDVLTEKNLKTILSRKSWDGSDGALCEEEEYS